MKLLVTGAAGYIGSHTCVRLLEAGHDVVAADNLSNGSLEALERVRELSGRPLVFRELDVTDGEALDRTFREFAFDAAVHFAGLKSVGESASKPLDYYYTNVTGTLLLCAAMARAGVKKLVFSSSATVYGTTGDCPIGEAAPLSAANPYGRSKLMAEELLRDLCASDPEWSVAILRYFNPIGAHASGRIGEDPNGPPNNLVPYIAQVAVRKRPELLVFGGDYPTEDGTGVRDYLHVEDLAEGHLKALDKTMAASGAEAYNLGTGRGYSVLEVVREFERASGRSVPYRIAGRRPGDAAVSFADPAKAERELGWKATKGIREMCADAWNWQSRNPDGYGSGEAERDGEEPDVTPA